MGRPPKRLEDLSPNSQRKREGMSESEILIHRAQQTDHVYYSSVRKKVKMTDAYLCASEELRERMIMEAVRDAERWRHTEKRTWQQKAEALGFTRNATGDWEQNLRILSRSKNNSHLSLTPSPCEKSIQEKETGSPSLRTIMVCLSELGSNLNRRELDVVERQVQDLIQVDEDRNKSNGLITPLTPAKTTAPIAVMSVPAIDFDRARLDFYTEEQGDKKRKRDSFCDSTDNGPGESCHWSGGSDKENAIGDSSKAKSGGEGHFDIPQVPAPAASVVDLIGNTEPESEKAIEEVPDGGDVGVKHRNAEGPAADADAPNGILRTLKDAKKVKLENEGSKSGGNDFKKPFPVRTGYFDNLTW